MMLHDVWLLLGVFLALTSILLLRGLGEKSHRRRLPPSPSGAWPIFGHSPLLNCELPHRRLMELAKKYGPLMHLRLFSVPVVVVSSADMLREFYQVNDAIMASRAPIAALYILGFSGNNISSRPYDDLLRQRRRLVTQEPLTLKRLNELQAVRRGEVLHAVESVFYNAKQNSNSSVDMRQELKNKAFNNVTQMLCSKRFFGPKIESEVQSEEFLLLVETASSLATVFDIGDYIPFLQRFDLQGIIKKLRQTNAWFSRFIEKSFLEDKRGANGRANGVKNFIDTLLELQRRENLSDDVVKGLISDILVAATDTSSTALEWLMAELQLHPKVMLEVQAELDKVVGRNRIVDESDIPSLKYLQACIKESMRIHPAVPLGVPHESTASCTIAGYHIPAKVRVLVNVTAIHMNPETYNEPETFQPERFLASGPNSRIELKGQHFDLVPFGTGRRICVGLNLGLLMVQLGAAALLQAYDWKFPAGMTRESLDMSEGLGTLSHLKVPLRLVRTPRLPDHVYAAENNELGE